MQKKQPLFSQQVNTFARNMQNKVFVGYGFFGNEGQFLVPKIDWHSYIGQNIVLFGLILFQHGQNSREPHKPGVRTLP